MSFSIIDLVARLALVATLYLFLIFVVRALYRDLRVAGKSLGGAGSPRATGAPQLTVLSAGKTAYAAGQVFRLQGPTVIGRDPHCDIPVDDDFVSSHHLRLLPGPDGWQAEDLGSTNGSRLNSARLPGTALLQQGDILDIGRFRVRFSLQQP